MENKTLIAPSILGVSEENLNLVCTNLIASGSDLIHFDVMDGQFVSNTSFTGKEIDIVSSLTNDSIIDVHLMVNDVKSYLDKFMKKHVKLLTFHYEATCSQDINTLISYVHDKDYEVGLAVSPDTPIEVLKPYLDKIDLALVMSVVPGKGGQKFMPIALDKLAYLAKEKKEHNYSYLIEVDGGINNETCEEAKNAGAEVLVAGSYILKSENYKERVDILKR